MIVSGDGWSTSVHLSSPNAIMAAKDALKTTHRTRDEVRELIVKEIFTAKEDPYKEKEG